MAPDPILSEVRPIREESVRPVHGKPATENAGGGGGGGGVDSGVGGWPELGYSAIGVVHFPRIPLPRWRTWNTIPRGATIAIDGMPATLPNLSSRANICACPL